MKKGRDFKKMKKKKEKGKKREKGRAREKDFKCCYHSVPSFDLYHLGIIRVLTK